MPKLINWELVKHPGNWFVVLAMVAIAAVAWGLVDPLRVNASSQQGSPP